jgi:D-ribose pyranose/furanose isomerase RbsD
MADELVFTCPSSTPKLPLKSQTTLPDVDNVTSILVKDMKLGDLIRELVLSSEINVNENDIENVVRSQLSNLNVNNNGSPSEKQVLEMSLRGYLGIINELLYLRYSVLQKIEEILNVNLNILSKKN